MRVVIGVNGKGYGHTMRQACLLPWLLERGHQVAMFVSGRSAEFFGTHFAQVPCFRVKIPSLIPCSPQGADFRRSAQLVENRSDDFFPTNYSAIDNAISALRGTPDLVLSDYEPVAAMFAYASLCPLITIDNQSSFLGFCVPPVQSLRNGAQRTREEECSHLHLFFPKAEERFAVSLFAIPYPQDPRFCVTIIPPIIRPDVRRFVPPVGQNSRKKIVVYLATDKLGGSTCSDVQRATDLSELFASRTDIDFVMFTDEWAPGASNVSIRKFNSEGLPSEMGTCDAVIATAGHMLLSEVLYFRKPLLALPRDTFEQNYNARCVESAGVGLAAPILTAELLDGFVADIPRFRDAYQQLGAIGGIDTRDGTSVLTETLQSKYAL